MDSKECKEPEVSFVVHVWREKGPPQFWRGRVVDVNALRSGAFEDAQGLLSFMRIRLRALSSVVLPFRRGGE